MKCEFFASLINSFLNEGAGKADATVALVNGANRLKILFQPVRNFAHAKFFEQPQGGIVDRLKVGIT